MTDTALTVPHPARRWQFWVFVIVMLALTVLFLGLAKWQYDRLHWKEGLIAQAAANMKLPPSPFPPPSQWQSLDPQTFQYRPVTLSGRYLNDQAIRVFVGLSDAAQGQYSGPGYWIMTPFAIDGGGTVFIDRGFVPQNAADQYANDKSAPAGPVAIAGVAVASEDADFFTPPADKTKRIDWVRSISRMSAMLAPGSGPVAPVYIDLPAGPRGTLPQGGETTVDFPNNHLGYLYTWLGFALTTIIMLAEWVRRQWTRGKD